MVLNWKKEDWKMKNNYICPNICILEVEADDIIRTSIGLTLRDNQNVYRDGADFDDLFYGK